MLIPHGTVRHLHFVGIGGIGMSGIAEVLHNLGYRIKGSDASENHQVQRLRTHGIEIFIGHDAQHVSDAQVVIISSAVKTDNPEVIAARASGIPVILRAEMLAEIMRLRKSIAIAGTHGKTTTTSIMACLLDGAGMDPTVVNGGVINAYNTNARLGLGEWAVVEADESDGSFTKLPATIAVITNVDPEHMEYYKDFETLKQAFVRFVQNIPFYGLGVMCSDHPTVRELLSRITDRRLVTYGFEEGAMIRGLNVRSSPEGMTFDVEIAQGETPQILRDIFVPLMGDHNVLNTLSVIAVAQELGISEVSLRQSLSEFKGVKRRFTQVGVFNDVRIIDDYAHHPVEITNVLKAARQCTKGRIVVVAQPHRYSRLHDLFGDFAKCFQNCDTLILTPVYSAGEDPISGATSHSLAQAIREYTAQNVIEIRGQDELAAIIMPLIEPGDLILCLGAGTISTWAQSLAEQLEKLQAHNIVSFPYSQSA